MSESPVVTRIELDAFEIRIPGIVSDAAGMGVSYQPGPGSPQTRFGVRVHSDTGLVGAYVPPRGRARVIMAACEALAHGLIGKPVLQRERHYLAMRRATKHIGEVGIGALDIALWDLAGKHHGASIATLLGGIVSGCRPTPAPWVATGTRTACPARRPTPISPSSASSSVTPGTRCTAGRPATPARRLPCCAPWPSGLPGAWR